MSKQPLEDSQEAKEVDEAEARRLEEPSPCGCLIPSVPQMHTYIHLFVAYHMICYKY